MLPVGTEMEDCSLFLTPDLLSPSRASHPGSLALFREKVGTAAGKIIRFVRTARAFQNPCSASDCLLSSCEVPSVLRWQLRSNGKQREWKPSSQGGDLLCCCFAWKMSKVAVWAIAETAESGEVNLFQRDKESREFAPACVIIHLCSCSVVSAGLSQMC